MVVSVANHSQCGGGFGPTGWHVVTGGTWGLLPPQDKDW